MIYLFKDLFRKQIIVEKIFSKRRKNDPDDNDPEKVTKLNMKCGLVLNTAIYMVCKYHAKVPMTYIYKIHENLILIQTNKIIVFNYILWYSMLLTAGGN